jgi:hypothetical protein
VQFYAQFYGSRTPQPDMGHTVGLLWPGAHFPKLGLSHNKNHREIERFMSPSAGSTAESLTLSAGAPGPADGVPRATRYEIETSICFRVHGEQNWREGKTRNMSAYGVLFLTDAFVQPNTLIDMRFVVSPQSGDLGSAEVFCRGQVVRAYTESAESGGVVLASTITHVKFNRQKAAVGLVNGSKQHTAQYPVPQR